MLDTPTLTPLQAMDEQVLACPLGGKIETTFGSAPATLFCVERLSVPTKFYRFRVVVYGVQIAEVAWEQRNDGSIIREQL